MDFTEIIVEVKTEDIEKAGNIAHMVVPYGIYIEDYSSLEEETLEIAHIDLIDEELLKKDRNIGYIHVYINAEENFKEAILFLEERYREAGINFKISTNICKDEDFMNSWKKYFKPIPVGEKLLIRPIWEEPIEQTNRVILNLEPGLAFGTGTHETTRLCLTMLEKYLKQGMNVLDVGCGSGILSIASILLGASSATGIDIDQTAVKTAIENAKNNNCEKQFTALCGDLTEKITKKYDIVLANIVADVILRLNTEIEKYMQKNALYIMSGIIDTRANEVIESVSKKFDVIEKQEENGWVCLVARLKN